MAPRARGAYKSSSATSPETAIKKKSFRKNKCQSAADPNDVNALRILQCHHLKGPGQGQPMGNYILFVPIGHGAFKCVEAAWASSRLMEKVKCAPCAPPPLLA